MPEAALHRRATVSLGLLGLALLGLPALLGCAAARDFSRSPQFADGHFRNVVPMPERSFAATAALYWRSAFGKPEGTAPERELPVRPVTRAELDAAADGSLWRLAHATVLIKLQGQFWLTDPVFSARVSPLSWVGPKRFHASPIAVDELPPIKAVIISHDHYDHLDHASVLALVPKVEWFVTPLGVGDRLIEWGVPGERVRQLDWWESFSTGGVSLVATPAQHFSGRTLTDRNRTLWASWALLGSERRIFFSGDTGYHADFKTIGDRLGPFHTTLIECGAYNTAWPMVHMQPEQVLQAHRDLRGQQLVPIHNSSFDLAFHPWREPLERIAALARQQDVALALPAFGERITMPGP